MTVGLDEITIPSPTSNYNLTVDLSEMRSDIVRELNEIIATIGTKATTNSPATFSTITASGVGTVTGSLNVNAPGLNPLVLTNNSSLYGLTRSGAGNFTFSNNRWNSNTPIYAASDSAAGALATNAQVAIGYVPIAKASGNTTITGETLYRGPITNTYSLVNQARLEERGQAWGNWAKNTMTPALAGIKRGIVGPYSIGSNATSGVITINHGVGANPGSIQLTPFGDNGDCTIFASIIDRNATNFTCHMRNLGNTDGSVYLYWMAVE